MTDLVRGIAAQMRYLSDRQQVLAGNIANSETPGFKARDLAAPDFAAMLDMGGPQRIGRPAVRITAAMAALGARPGSSSGVVLDRDTSETKPDGNNVTIEDQLLKLGEVQADFAAATGLYRKHQALMQAALGKRGG